MRLLSCLVTLTVLICAECLADEGATLPSDADAREAKIYDTIGEIVVRRDQMLQKFAVVMHGEHVRIGSKRDPNPIIGPVINARLTDRSKDFDMKSGYGMSPENPDYESGTTTIQIGTTHKAIDHNPFLQPILIKPPGTRPSDWKKAHPVTGGADPYDDYLFGAMSFISDDNYGAIEEAILGKYELTKTEVGVGNKLIGHFTW
ncbi:MAG: hypothetical protein MI861_04685, partial [Pirellulales bacterium]|nr:hypothetical protein [Pirellulales bacterium]